MSYTNNTDKVIVVQKIKTLERLFTGALPVSAVGGLVGFFSVTNIPFGLLFSSVISTSTILIARRYVRKNEKAFIKQLKSAKDNNQLTEKEYLEFRRRLENITVGKT